MCGRWVTLLTAAVGGFAVMVPAMQAAGYLPEFDYLVALLLIPGITVGGWVLFYFKRPKLLTPYLLVVIMAGLAVLWTAPGDRGRGLVILSSLAATLPLIALFWRYTNLVSVQKLFAWTTALALVASVWLNGWVLTDLGETLVGDDLLTNRNVFAAQLAIACLFALSVHRRTRNKLYLWLSLVLGTAVVFTQSRAQLAALLVGLLLMGTGKRAQTLRFRLAVAGVVLLIGLVFLSVSTTSVEPFGVVGRTFDPQTEWTNGRAGMLMATDEAFTATPWTPLFGSGLGGVDTVFGRFAPGYGDYELGAQRSSHNTAAEWLLATGLIGLVPAAVAFWTLRRSIRIGGRDQTAFLGCALVSAMALVYYRTPFWPVVGATLWVPVLSAHWSNSRAADLSSDR